MEKDEWNGDMMGYKGEGEWGLRTLLGAEEVSKMYMVKSCMWIWKGRYGGLEEEYGVFEERGTGSRG